MAELATQLIEIAQKRGCEDGDNLPDVVRNQPIKLEDKTIQVPQTFDYTMILYPFYRIK